jgi:hypothetical protein
MILVIFALIIFGIGTTALVLWTFRQPSVIKIVASVLFVVTWVAAIIWSLNEFI